MEWFTFEEIENNKSNAHNTVCEEKGRPSEFPVTGNFRQRKANDFPPVVCVFNIDHVLEQILDHLQISDLLNCRLVSLRLRLISKKPLEKLLTMKFDENILRGKLYGSEENEEKEPKTLNKLLSFLQTSQGFPCVKFELNETSLMESGVRRFLDFYGPCIEELTLGCLSFDENERDVLICIQNLLRYQTPNLRFLRIEVKCQVSWINNVRINEYANVFQPNDPELNEIRQIGRDFKNLKLKVVHMVLPWNVKVMETILQLSLNLEEIKFCHDDDKLVGFKEMCSLDPKNRIHLIKSLPLHVYNYDECEEILSMCQAVGVNLQLRKLMLRINEDEGGDDFNFEQKMWLANIINRIFEHCCNSIEYIQWGSLQILSAIKFPQVMPKVKELRFTCFLRSGLHVPKSVFTADFSFSTIFPNVHSIFIFAMACWDNVPYFLKQLFQKSMPLIKNVQLERDHFRSKVKSGPMKKISKLFPNANVYQIKLY